MSFENPGVVAQGANTYISVSTGWCDPEKEKAANYSRSDPITESVVRWDSSIKISGRVDPSHPGMLRGTWTQKDPSKYPGGISAETVITWEIQRPPSP